MSIRSKILAILGAVFLVGGAFLLGGQIIGKNGDNPTNDAAQVNRPYLGITSVDVTPNLVTNLGLTVNQGVCVLRVDTNSPAAKAGLQAETQPAPGTPPGSRTVGDVIIAVDNTQIANVEALTKFLGTRQVGDSVSITVSRNNQSLKLNAVLATWPATNEIIVRPVQSASPQEPLTSRHFGSWLKLAIGVLLGLVLGGVILAITKPMSRQTQSVSKALDIAKERYARGELTPQEFEQLKKDLS